MFNNNQKDLVSNNMQFIVESIHSGKRLDVFLSDVLSGISRSQVQKLISSEQVNINGVIARKKDAVNSTDVIDVSLNGFFKPEKAPVAQEIPLEILYEDEYLIAVNKQCGLVVHPGSGVRDGTLVNALAFHCKNLSEGFATDRPGIVHRLDKDTTGVIIAAKNNQVHDQLAAAFMNRKVCKEYVGFCVGKTAQEHGLIDLPLDRSRREPIKRAPSISGKPSKTEYFVLAQRAGILAVKFLLHTGRTHQIRVHCSAMGFPIVGDMLYGGGKDRVSKIEPMDRPFAYSVFKCFNRQALHAYSISFLHPVTGNKLSISAPVPHDFEDACIRFGEKRLFDSPVDWHKSLLC